MSYRDHPDSANTDISTFEIDAFDELLNQIEAGNRTPNSRSGFSQMGPHDRIDQAYALSLSESLAFSASRFLDRVHTAHESRPGANVPHPNLWETIMLSNTQPATGTFATDQVWSAPVSKPRTSSPAPNPTRRNSRFRTNRWPTYLNIALVVAILLAAYGFWDNRGNPGGEDDNQGIAWQASSATPSDGTPTSVGECPPIAASEQFETEFTDNQQLVANMAVCINEFEWPEGFTPNLDKIGGRWVEDTSSIGSGAARSMMLSFNQCAWSITWLEARGSGDEILEAEALSYITDVFPQGPWEDMNRHWESMAEAAANDDPSLIEQFMVNCYPLDWTDHQGEPPAVEGATIGTPVINVDSPCDLSEDFPIFSNVTESPISTTALLLTPDGELILTCADDPDGTVVLSNVLYANPTTWPGLVQLQLKPARVDTTRTALLDLKSGKLIEVGRVPDSVQYDIYNDDANPWLIAPAVDGANDWIVVDLRTMEVRTLSSIVGGPLTTPINVLTSSNGGGNDIAIGITTVQDQYQITQTDTGLLGNMLVINDTFDSAHWISAPTIVEVGFTQSNLALSPDGTSLALRSGEFDNLTFVILSTADGATVSQSKSIAIEMDYPTMLWREDSTGIVFTANENLNLLSARQGVGETTMFTLDDPGSLKSLRQTYDPNTFVVARGGVDDLDIEIANGVEQLVYSVNITTGEFVTFDGWDLSNTVDWLAQDRQFLVMYEPTSEQVGTRTYQVYEAVTGTPVGEPFEASYSLGPDSMAWISDGSLGAIAFDTQTIYLLEYVDGTSLIQTIPSPADLLGGHALMQISSDGRWLTFSTNTESNNDTWLLSLTDQDAEWIQIPDDTASTQFVRGDGE